MKYSDQIADWLIQLGYTHCFYVGGGNIMHLIESLSKKLTCVPVINEVDMPTICAVPIRVVCGPEVSRIPRYVLASQ